MNVNIRVTCCDDGRIGTPVLACSLLMPPTIYSRNQLGQISCFTTFTPRSPSGLALQLP